MLIDPNSMTIEELVDDIILSGDDLTKYYDNIDNEILSLCWSRGVLPSDVPVDEGGYVTSLPLKLCATYYGIYRICLGYRGSGGDPDDVYAKAAKDYYDMYTNKKKEITKEIILGGDMTTLIPLAYQVNQGFFQI